MPSLTEIIAQNADRFADIPDAAKAVESITAKVKELGLTPMFFGNAKDNPDVVPYARVQELSDQKGQLTTQNGELAAQLETLKKELKGNEGAVKQIEDLQTKLTATEGSVKEITIKSAVKIAALAAKAKDPEDVLKMVDMSKVTMNADGTVTGIEEQIKGLQESKGYLFGDATPGAGGGGNIGGGNPAGNDLDARIAEAEKAGNVMLAIALKNEKFKIGQ